MISQESSLRLSATILVLSRRGQLNSTHMNYINTVDITSYYNDNKSVIEKYCCDIYGDELIDNIKKKNVKHLDFIIDDITEYNCYQSIRIHEAVRLMVINANILSVDKYLTRLNKYVTIDNLIDAINEGDVDLYNKIKSLLSMRSIEGIDSPPYTMTNLTLEEISTLAIVYAMICLAMYPSNNRLYIMRDILRYVEFSKYIKSERLDVIVNDLGKYLSKGRVLSWNVSLIEKIEKNGIKIPHSTIDEQISLYNEEFRHILASYPKPRPRIRIRN